MTPCGALELGGTKARYALVTADGEITGPIVVLPTATPDVTLPKVREYFASHGVGHVGIASFGPLDLPSHIIAPGTKPGWGGCDLGSYLSEFERTLVTDVDGAAIAEREKRGCESLAYITVGTGVGVGLSRRNEGARTWHAELGHIKLAGDAAGHCSYHGGCVEGLISGPALRARIDGDPAKLKNDDPIWKSVAEQLGRLIATITFAYGVRDIVIGGGVLEGRAFLRETSKIAADVELAAFRPTPRVSAPRFEHSGLQGAAILAKQSLEKGR